MDTVTVSKKALEQLLCAVNGPAHYVRELQATRNLPGADTTNPINILINEFNSNNADDLKTKRNRLIDEAAKVAQQYAQSCEIGPERNRAFDCYEAVLYSTMER